MDHTTAPDEGDLTPSLMQRFWWDLLGNSVQVPAVLMLFLLICRNSMGWWLAAAMVALVGAAGAQSLVIVSGNDQHRLRLFAANLIVPAILCLAWLAFLHPWLPWQAVLLSAVIGLLVGIAQTLRRHQYGRPAQISLVLENVIRTSAVVGVYGLADDATSLTLGSFLAEPPHAYLLAAVVAFGTILGLEEILGIQHLDNLRHTAERLKEVSQWSMNASHLQQAITDERALTPVRRERAVLFADIRGFTAWSESRSPEEVLNLLSHFYAAAERTWLGKKPVKRKFTGDEILLVFADPVDAARTALALRDASQPLLGPQGLGLGIGLHHGPLIEGLIGSRNLRAFDVLGDTVNTGKRVCDQARTDEILCTFTFYQTAPQQLVVGDSHSARAKGKSNPVILALLLGVKDAPVHEASSQPASEAMAEPFT